MKKIIITFLIGFYSISTIAQTNISPNKACDLFKNLVFKNGVDAITIKATYDGLFRSPDYTILRDLDKEKKLRYNEFGIDTGETESSTSISFAPEHCSKLYSGTIVRKSFYRSHINTTKINLNTLKRGTVIYLTCMVFEPEKYNRADGTHFFVITDITIEKPSGFK